MSKKASSKWHYQPVAEFDDFTLARKREYWRSKKREQRARKSSARKDIRNENPGLCKQTISMSTAIDEDFSETPKVSSDPSLHNCDVLCKLDDVVTAKNSFSSGLFISESNVGCQTERCFQRNKLDHVLPQIPEASTIFLSSNKKVVRDPITESSIINGTMVDQSESLYLTCHSLAMANSTLSHKTGALNSIVAPSYNNQNKPQIKNVLPLQPLTMEQDFVGSKSPMTSRKTCAFASDRNPSRAETIRMGMTEEEMAAKRRENWRIKKREQRAKPAMNRERSLGQVQSSHTGIAYSSSPVNGFKALRGIKHKSVKSFSLSQGSQGKKIKESRASVAINTTQFVWATKPNVTQTINKHKGQKPKFPYSPKKCHQKSLLGVTKFKSAEDRHAKQKEYWRIKKREQRARLSAEGKTQLKERDAFKHCAEHYRSFDHTCEVQAGIQKAIQSTEETFGSSSETIGDFIKDDGTVSSSNTFEASLATTYEFPNVKCIEKVQFQIQVSSPLYPDAPSVLKSGVQNNFSTDFLSSDQKSIGHHFSNNSKVKCKLASDTVMDSMTLTIQSESLTEEKRIARMREYWRVKKREQRASRASRVSHGLCKSNVSVVKQTEQNHSSTKGCPSIMPSHCVNPSANTRVCDTSTIAPLPKATIKQEQIFPSIQAVFSLSEMYPFVNVKQQNTSSAYTLNETAEADHNANSLQAVASMKKLLEESFITVKDRNEPVTFKTESDLLSEDIAPNAQNISLQCDISNANHKKDFRLSPSLYHSPSWTLDSSSKYTIHHESHNLIKGSAQPLSRDNQNICDNRIDPKQRWPSQTMQERQLGKNCKLQQKREYWRLMKRQQRARKAKARQGSKDAALQNLGSQPEQIRDSRSQNHHSPSDGSQRFPCSTDVSSNVVYTTGTEPSTLLLRRIIPTQHHSKERSLLPADDQQGETYQAPQEKPWQRQLSDTSQVMQPLSQDAATYKQIPMQNKTKMFAKPTGHQIQPAGLFIGKSTPNPEEDPDEVIHRRRMHWRIKKQEQRARKAVRDSELRRMMANDLGRVPLQSVLHQDFASQSQDTTSVSCVGLSRKPEDQLGDIAEETGLQDEGVTVTQEEWRRVYLMDSDPINPLLVCMVCGEQEYSLSIQGVMSHIEEVHPHTLSLGEQERQDILAAWDKQVAIRECFITNQLQQQSRDFTDLRSNCLAEIEVKIEADD
nr:uncharacterized protein si:dkey-28a3.2 isoform X1 [Misgurnus anguillicaudatus]XP_055052383.1 uncharacterized protein si:dkey-28a3.2 isoform X1 [Misgurnus anguillicaudatus]XP_055052392.1 uncharacterized protein si:dkey-28a3.2 isoform X1 [Misgurnus anguillicaudatus]